MKIILFLFAFSSLLLSRDSIEFRITDERVPLMILASSGGDDSESIESQVTRIVANEAVKLKRFRIIDRTTLEAILEEQALQMSGVVSDSAIVRFGQISAAREALIVDVITFGQKGVKPEEDKEEDRKDRKTARKAGLFGVIVKSLVDVAVSESKKDQEEEYEDNIQTTLQARVTKVDTETGEAITSFTISSSYTGGTRAKSLATVLTRISFQSAIELRSMYRLFTEVLETGPGHVLLYLGDEIGVTPGTLFRITKPRTQRTIRGKSVEISGEAVAIVRSSSVAQNSNNANILRKWGQIEPGYEALEMPSAIFSWGMFGTYGLEIAQTSFGFQAYWKSFSRMGGGITFGLGTVKDTRNDIDFTLNFGGDFYFRLVNNPAWSLMGTVKIPVNIAFRPDDDGNNAFSTVFSPRIGGRIDLMTSPNRDLFIQVEYAIGAAQSPWQYTEGEDEDSKTYRAKWNGVAPEIDPRGIYISLGIRFISFASIAIPQLY